MAHLDFHHFPYTFWFFFFFFVRLLQYGWRLSISVEHLVYIYFSLGNWRIGVFGAESSTLFWRLVFGLLG